MEKTIIEHMSCISEKLRSEKPERLTRMVRSCIDISPENLAKAEEDIAALRDILRMNTMQVLILTAILQNSSRNNVDCDDISAFLGLDYLKFLTYSQDLEDLKRRGYVRIKRNGDIVLPGEVLRSLKDNRVVEPEKTSGLDTTSMLARIRRKLKLLDDDLLTQDEFIEIVGRLMHDNPGTSLAKAYKRYCSEVGTDEQVFFLAVLIIYYGEEDDQVAWYQVDGYFSLLAPSGDLIPITVTSRRLIFSKLLEFSIPDSTQDLVRATYVDKCNFNSLLGSVKFYKKLHPTE